MRDLTGRRFGRLIARWPVGRLKSRNTIWLASCDCGNVRHIPSGRMENGGTKSCGCLSREATANRSRTHGHTVGRKQSREYRSYGCALNRCTNPNYSRFREHGGRGIEFRFNSFQEFISCLGERPIGTSLDRFPNNDGHYEPGNVRWATAKEQANNRRRRTKQ